MATFNRALLILQGFYLGGLFIPTFAHLAITTLLGKTHRPKPRHRPQPRDIGILD